MSTTFKRAPDVHAVSAENGLAVFDMARGAMFKANGVGSEIWRAVIEQRRDIRSVAASLAGRFGLTSAQAQEDVSGFVGELLEQGLLCEASSG